MSPGRRKYKLPKNLTLEKQSGNYRFRNPLTGKRTYMGKDRVVAIKRAEELNEYFKLKQEQAKYEQGAPISVGHVVRLYMELVVPYKPWADSTRKNKLMALRKYEREFGKFLFTAVDRVFIAEWLDKYEKADTYNDHRTNLIDVWAFGISRQLADINEPEKTMERSNSLKIAANRRDRGVLTIEAYQAIHKDAPVFLQVAMELSLITLQGRAEICKIQDADLRNGFLYFVRQKTSAESDMAFLRIQVTEEIRAIRAKSRAELLHCPYWVNRRPIQARAKRNNNKLHPFAVNPDYLSKAFQKARDNTGLFNNVPMKNRPTFHSMRGLGGRIYRELGYSKDYVQALMAHGDEKVTDIYLENPNLVKDDHFRVVEAGMKMSDLTGLEV